MKTRFLTFVLFTVFLLTSSKVFAQDGVGLGGELLSPTGISYKVPINESSALTGALGFSITENFSSATFEINYIMFRDSENINIGSGELHPYFGGGISYQLIDGLDNRFALQVPVGIEYRIDDAPYEIYMDIGPYIRLSDPTLFSLTSSLGFRYRF